MDKALRGTDVKFDEIPIFGTKGSQACSVGAVLPNLRKSASKRYQQNGPKHGDICSCPAGTIAIRKEKETEVIMRRTNEEVD